MNERHRQQQFQSPFFSPAEIELDPDKKLWVPGKKKIFLPSKIIKPVIDWDWAIFKPSLITRQLEFMHYFDSICVPGRNEWLGIPREPIRVPEARPITWSDIVRSTEPFFRSYHAGRNHD